MGWAVQRRQNLYTSEEPAQQTVLSAGGVLQFPATHEPVLLCLLQEVERNLQDAMQVCRNVLIDPQLVPGGGATEMAVSHALTEKSKGMTGVEQWPYRAVAQALEVIPRTLIQNCGASTIRVLTSLRVRRVAWAHLKRSAPSCCVLPLRSIICP